MFLKVKKLQEENEELKNKIVTLEKEQSDRIFNLQQLYDRTMEQKLDYMKSEYDTKIKRKEQVIKIVTQIEAFIGKDFSILYSNELVDNYIKLLNFLEEK